MIATLAAFFLLCLTMPQQAVAQTGDDAVAALVDLGFENVSCTEETDERIYVLQNSAYRVQGKGISKAVDVIQKMGLPSQKPCRIIVLDNNVPQISLTYQPIIGDSVPEARHSDWEVSYELDAAWKKARKTKRHNSSLFKVDIVVYPELSLQNLIITQVYQVLFNLNPTIEVSLWRGAKFTGQVIIPIYNEYGSSYEQIRQGFITLSQEVRLPYNIFLTASVGTFNNERWGGALDAKYIFKDERFSLLGRIGYSGRSHFDNWRWKVSPLKRLTWSVGGSFFWPLYNTNFTLKAEQYLLGEKGVRFDMYRKFRYTTIGFYAMKVSDTANSGFNGGFRFQVMLPPYGRYKRRGYIPRITTSDYMGMVYNAGNERYYGKSFRPRVDDNIGKENSFNPYFIKSELLNF